MGKLNAWEKVEGNFSLRRFVLKCQFTAQNAERTLAMMNPHIWVNLKYVHVFYGILQASHNICYVVMNFHL
jgi:hypothetical protein